jgi:hypothetical protein
MATTNKRAKAVKKRKAAKTARATRASRANGEVTIDCQHSKYPSVTIDFKQSVDFYNACDETRHLEFFDTSDKYRPIMFIQLEPNDSVTLVGGPDDDCHKPHECTYNVRIPGRKRRTKGRGQQIHGGSNRIIINS